jgi:hypothetical protein
MLLNHEAAIEFLVDAGPTRGLSAGLVRSVHAVLMPDLPAGVASLRETRDKGVNISGRHCRCSKPGTSSAAGDARAHRVDGPAPKEPSGGVVLPLGQPGASAALRGWQQASESARGQCPADALQPGTPLSFLDIESEDYAPAMTGGYESRDVSRAVDPSSTDAVQPPSRIQGAVGLHGVARPLPRQVTRGAQRSGGAWWFGAASLWPRRWPAWGCPRRTRQGSSRCSRTNWMPLQV